MNKKQVAVSFNNITKKFGKLVANENISFSIYKNEVHAIMGENGAGKSTLISILFGLYKPTSGTISINEKITKIKNPRHANALKIAVLPQHFKLIDNMSVVENVILGYEKLHKNKNPKDVLTKICKKFKIKIDLSAKVAKLPIAEKQSVELLKILWRDADIIIFDEPTSILSPIKIKEFLNIVKYMKSIGKTIIIITHKLNEVMEIADRGSVIRKGKFVKTVEIAKTNEKKLAELMVGKSVDLNLSNIKRTKTVNPKNILHINKLNYKAKGFETSLKDLNLEIVEGEIVGIAAIDGNGQSELMKSIAGILKSKGRIEVDGINIQGKSIHSRYFNYHSLKNMDKEHKQSYKKAILEFKQELKKISNKIRKTNDKKSKMKLYNKYFYFLNQIYHTKVLMKKPKALISHIPEDRHKYGLVLNYSVSKNSILQDIDFYSKFGLINYKDIKRRMKFLKEKYDIRGIKNYSTQARVLSGGNQQKIILAREIERKPKLLLAAHPTRGLDVGAIKNVYESIIEARNNGMSVLLESGELDEIMQVSDKICIMHNGKIVSVTKRGQLTKTQIGMYMTKGRL